MLKQIGSAARKEIEAMSSRKVFLQLNVKVRQNWRDDEKVFARLVTKCLNKTLPGGNYVVLLLFSCLNHRHPGLDRGSPEMETDRILCQTSYDAGAARLAGSQRRFSRLRCCGSPSDCSSRWEGMFSSCFPASSLSLGWSHS